MTVELYKNQKWCRFKNVKGDTGRVIKRERIMSASKTCVTRSMNQ